MRSRGKRTSILSQTITWFKPIPSRIGIQHKQKHHWYHRCPAWHQKRAYRFYRWWPDKRWPTHDHRCNQKGKPSDHPASKSADYWPHCFDSELAEIELHFCFVKSGPKSTRLKTNLDRLSHDSNCALRTFRLRTGGLLCHLSCNSHCLCWRIGLGNAPIRDQRPLEWCY